MCLILNQRAGGMALVGDWVQQEAERRHITVFAPTDLWGAVDAVHTAVHAGFQRLIIGGGDGTVSKLINSLSRHWQAVEFAVLPVGTGNDWARSLGVPVDDLQAAFELAVSGDAYPTDIVHIAGSKPEYCINAATAGVGARIAAELHPDDKKRWGPLAYWLTAVTQLVQLKEYRVRLHWEDKAQELSVYGMVIANGAYAGGGFPIAPGANVADGQLDVTIFPVLPMIDLLAAGLNFALGWTDPRRLPTIRTTRLQVTSQPALQFSVDGEPTRAIETVFEVVPGALRVVRTTR